MVRSPAASWRRLVLATAALTAAGIPGAGLTNPAPAGAATAYVVNSAAAGVLTHDLEADRARVHFTGLRIDPALNRVALEHSMAMARAGRVYDTANMASVGTVVPNWTGLGENVGRGPSPAQVAYALVHSARHLSIILGHYNLVGVGVVSTHGQLWVTEEFADAG